MRELENKYRLVRLTKSGQNNTGNTYTTEIIDNPWLSMSQNDKNYIKELLEGSQNSTIQMTINKDGNTSRLTLAL